MKELLLMRHGKSDWAAQFDGDRDRPINKRGRRAAMAVGEAIARAERVPDIVVSSPAVRAATTAKLAIQAGGWRCEERVDEALYGAGAEGVLDVVRRHGRDSERVMVVGHEPTMSAVVSRVIGGGAVRFPTAAVAGLRLHITAWSAFDWRRGELDLFLTPRFLGA
jgi:phosphohistidine phosphatase